MRINKFLPFALIYFFVNSVGLPYGLTWMAVLGPFFYVWVILKRKEEILLPFLLMMMPFIIVHIFFVKVEFSSYLITLLNLVLMYFFGQAVYTYFKQPVDHEKVFRRVLYLNFILCCVAIVIYFTPFYSWAWIRQNVSQGLDQLLRLKLFTYEASYYALLFVPIFAFYLWQYILMQNTIGNRKLLLMIFLPMVLSFSVGVIAALMLSGFLTFILHIRKLAPKKRIINGYISLGFCSIILLSIGFLLFRDNVLFTRLDNIVTGADTSSQGRTTEAFTLVQRILDDNNKYWGIGLGQLKWGGEEIIRSYYLYFDQTAVAIPNAAAETLLLFGWVGLVLRLLIEIALFFMTRVWSNYYRLLLFGFIFIYQFTGSYITNPAEYVLWILAFTNAFPQFNAIRSKTFNLEKLAPHIVQY
jgi:hypothetical protein